MFIPSEAVYAEIHGSLTEVVDESHRLRVWIVSPTTMWALLNTVRAVLKDVQMREQADVIQAEVGLLLQDATRLDDRVGALERHFNQTVDDVRKIRISTDKVMRRGERIGELQLESKNPEAEEDGTSELPFSPPARTNRRSQIRPQTSARSPGPCDRPANDQALRRRTRSRPLGPSHRP